MNLPGQPIELDQRVEVSVAFYYLLLLGLGLLVVEVFVRLLKRNAGERGEVCRQKLFILVLTRLVYVFVPNSLQNLFRKQAIL